MSVCHSSARAQKSSDTARVPEVGTPGISGTTQSCIIYVCRVLGLREDGAFFPEGVETLVTGPGPLSGDGQQV